MSGTDHPYGRRSLFSGAPGPDDDGVGDPPHASGRAALFSHPTAAPGAHQPAEPADRSLTGVVVECSRCERRRVLDPLTALRHVGPSLWWPLHRPSRYLSCPACGRWAWCRVGLAALGA